MTTHVARDGQVFGTFEDEDLKSVIAAGTVQLSDLGWREGMADWCSIAELLSADTTSPPQENALDNLVATIPPDSETPPAQPATEEQPVLIQPLGGTKGRSSIKESRGGDKGGRAPGRRR